MSSYDGGYGDSYASSHPSQWRLSGWLQGAGFGHIRRHPLRMSGGSLVVAEK